MPGNREPRMLPSVVVVGDGSGLPEPGGFFVVVVVRVGVVVVSGAVVVVVVVRLVVTGGRTGRRPARVWDVVVGTLVEGGSLGVTATGAGATSWLVLAGCGIPIMVSPTITPATAEARIALLVVMIRSASTL